MTIYSASVFAVFFSRARGFPPALHRYHQLAARSTAWLRTGTIVVHYRF